jgi:hypothetical protein
MGLKVLFPRAWGGRRGVEGEEPAGAGGGGGGILSSSSAEIGIPGGVGGAVSGDDHVFREPNGGTGGDDGVKCMG